MAIVLDHTIVPAHDNQSSARFFARIFGLPYDGAASHFAPVRVNETLVLDFDTRTTFDWHHYAFKVSEAEFDGIFQRVIGEGLVYGSGGRSRPTTWRSIIEAGDVASTSRTQTVICSKCLRSEPGPTGIPLSNPNPAGCSVRGSFSRFLLGSGEDRRRLLRRVRIWAVVIAGIYRRTTSGASNATAFFRVSACSGRSG
jgi:hypothetical protein